MYGNEFYSLITLCVGGVLCLLLICSLVISFEKNIHFIYLLMFPVVLVRNSELFPIYLFQGSHDFTELVIFHPSVISFPCRKILNSLNLCLYKISFMDLSDSGWEVVLM